ncbi:SRPBCC family protein [Ilumatobacter sp.]|uniref:SRPBCC family protein n=1 Tax=Ilumatobacter sp. TaxID=1967498 RepID=UPI003AF722E2
MAHVEFVVHHRFEASSRAVWDELVDWAGHAEWIPMTRVEVEAGDPTAVGARFTATTGLGPLALPDRMEVLQCDWDDEEAIGTCEVAKHGPVLDGRAGFTVRPTGEGASLEWVEDVTVPYTPQFLAPVLGWLGARGFSAGMRKLADLLAERSSAVGA